MIKYEPYIIYLAGGMTGLPKEVATAWRKDFKTIFYNALFKYKKTRSMIKLPSPYIIIDPSEAFFPSDDGDMIYEREAYNYETYWVSQANMIVASLDSLSSIGTAQELMLAHSQKKTIVGFIEYSKQKKLHPWNEIACNLIKVYNTPEQKRILSDKENITDDEHMIKAAFKKTLEEIADYIIYISH